MKPILFVLVGLILGGCAHRQCREQVNMPIVLPPPPEPPPTCTWQPPAWWNGTTGLTCLVHNVTRIPETVPIEYGLIMRDPEFGKAYEEQFPNTLYYVGGGCCYNPGYSPTKEVVRYCPECRRLEAEWIRHRKEGSAPSNGSGKRYVVRNGDTLYSIARKFGGHDTVERVANRNGILDPNRIIIGQVLYIHETDTEAQPTRPVDGSTRAR